MQNRIWKLAAVSCLLALSINGTQLLAQQPEKTMERMRPEADGSGGQLPSVRPELAEIHLKLATLQKSLSESDKFLLLGATSAYNKLVKGAPYSANAITETSQTLSDGNEITRRIEVRICRDREGRTRREQTLDSVARNTAPGNQPVMIMIDDPVAGLLVTLDPRTHTARRIQQARPLPRILVQPGDQRTLLPRLKETGTGEPVPATKPEVASKPDKIAPKSCKVPSKPDKIAKAGVKETVQDSVQKSTAVPSTETSRLKQKESGGHLDSSASTKLVEPLGRQVIEGVDAEGTRSTITIPAGEIGNRLPIEITEERWYSPELQVLIMTKHHDPRSGDSTYRLTAINRSEPDRSLFEVPPDYRLGWLGPEGGRSRISDRSGAPPKPEVSIADQRNRSKYLADRSAAPPKPEVRPAKND